MARSSDGRDTSRGHEMAYRQARKTWVIAPIAIASADDEKYLDVGSTREIEREAQRLRINSGSDANRGRFIRHWKATLNRICGTLIARATPCQVLACFRVHLVAAGFLVGRSALSDSLLDRAAVPCDGHGRKNGCVVTEEHDVSKMCIMPLVLHRSPCTARSRGAPDPIQLTVTGNAGFGPVNYSQVLTDETLAGGYSGPPGTLGSSVVGNFASGPINAPISLTIGLTDTASPGSQGLTLSLVGSLTGQFIPENAPNNFAGDPYVTGKGTINTITINGLDPATNQVMSAAIRGPAGCSARRAGAICFHQRHPAVPACDADDARPVSDHARHGGWCPRDLLWGHVGQPALAGRAGSGT